MIRTLNSLATLSERYETGRVPLRDVYTALEDLYALQRAGVLLVKRGYVELTALGLRKVEAETERRRAKEIDRAYRTKTAKRVVVAMQSLGDGWHSTADVERKAKVCDKNARFWLNRLRVDGRIERALGNSIAPGKYPPNSHVWRWRNV